MKHLKIEHTTAQYSLDGVDWHAIDKIDKTDLLTLLELAISDHFAMDDYVEGSIKNPAHNIIYSNLSSKFKELLKQKSRFKDESESLYKEALLKYSMPEEVN